MPAPFYTRDAGTYVPSESTRGPWDAGSQHAGPPAALLGHELELGRSEIHGPSRIGRITFEILRPVPIAPLRVETALVRPGRRVEMAEARLLDEEDRVLVRASAWRLRESRVELGELAGQGQPPAGPEAGNPAPFFPTGSFVGYHTAVEYSFVAGAFLEPGPATVWVRPLVPVIAGEEPTPLQRVLVAADSGNGVSAALDWRRYLFINVELSVHLHRYPAGEWVCLDSVTLPERDGIGLARTSLFDERGPIGAAAQALLVDQRNQ